MRQEEKWPDEVRLKMIEKSENYSNPEIYQYGYYDGYQLQNDKIEKLQQGLLEVNNDFDNFVNWLNKQYKDKDLYREYMDVLVPPLILIKTDNQNKI